VPVRCLAAVKYNACNVELSFPPPFFFCLPDAAAKYYKGLLRTSVDAASLTRHKWKFATKLSEEDKMEVATTRDSIDDDTSKTESFALTFGRSNNTSSASSSSAASVSRTVAVGPIGPSLQSRVSSTSALANAFRK
jgi:hypothetical protein